MIIEDQRCADKTKFGNLRDGDMFYSGDNLYMKIPLCMKQKPETASPSNPYFKEYKVNAVGFNKGLYGCLVSFEDGEVITPVSVKLLVANPGVYDD